MSGTARFLHVTDTHLLETGSSFEREDYKVNLGFTAETREGVVRDTLKRVAEDLQSNSWALDGVIFSGDALSRGVRGGAKVLLNLLLEHLASVGITADRIVAVPGNHDVPVGEAKDAHARYADFLNVWRAAGCKTPWLDGIDDGTADLSKHALTGPENKWIVVPVNSCHWSQVRSVTGALAAMWDNVPAILAEGDATLAADFKEQLARLGKFDMARISSEQLEALRMMLNKAPVSTNGRQLRMVALHHHLRAPSLREEVKAFSEITNVERLRVMLAQKGFKVLFHGHKHESRQHFDYIEEEGKSAPHRMLMVAGSSFSPEQHGDVMRIVCIQGMPWTPTLQVTPWAAPYSGIEQSPSSSKRVNLWEPVASHDHAPIAVQGNDFDDLYARVLAAAEGATTGRTVVAQFDLPDQAPQLRLPTAYPMQFESDEARSEWLSSLVTWWQQASSQLQKRVPYIHGTRLKRYASVVDQVERVKHLMKTGQTSRAIAVLIDPAADFTDEVKPIEFASFCMVQFIRRDLSDGPYLDCVAYYRAQEMALWWPINVAELHHLLSDIAKFAGAKLGRITTITPVARLKAKSPTHVAMPLVDRWLDQAPQNFFVLATALLNGRASTSRERKVINDWTSSFRLLADAAIAGPADGGPVVAIEGPNRLADFLLSAEGEAADRCRHLAMTLREIARTGGNPPLDHTSPLGLEWGQVLAVKLGEVIDHFEALPGLGENT